jgi:hypothetical protein
VESWPGGMPHQEIYLALLDQQASEAYAQIEKILGNQSEYAAARDRASDITQLIEKEYRNSQKGCYAFATNPEGTPNSPVDQTTTVYPALAWWSYEPALAGADECLKQFAGHALNTDWGLRDVANTEPIYDGMSYHQGSVWPLFTGWAALAEYRANQPLAGYQILMENANLTNAQDLGAVTELLSGDFNVPFGRSTSHQLWSSAMVITPILRGLFGISVDAQTKTITVNPHLPAGWDSADIRNLQLDGESAIVSFARKSDHLEVSLNSDSAMGKGWRLKSDLPGAKLGTLAREDVAKKLKFPILQGLRIPEPTLEVDPMLSNLHNVIESVATSLADRAPLPGSRTSRFRIIRSEYADHKLALFVEGLAGTEGVTGLVRHGHFIPKVESSANVPTSSDPADAKISMRELSDDPAVPALLVFVFPKGEGWKTITVTLTW